jgi:hypothetical protein
MSIHGLRSSLQEARALIEKHRPDRERDDWRQAEADLDALREALDGCDAELAGALDDLPDASERDVARADTAERHAGAAALFAAAGKRYAAFERIRRAIELAPRGGALSRELVAAEEDLDRFVDLQHARRLLAGRIQAPAERLLKRVAAGGGEGDPLAGAARAELDRPVPVSRAPALFTWNGIGLTLAGRRDARPDGTYVATHCVSVFGIPLVPLAAYRVAEGGDGSYDFFERQGLSRTARTARVLVPLAAALAAGWFAVHAYVHSPSRRIAGGTEAAAELERAGRADQALAAYGQLLAEFSSDADARAHLGPAAAGVVRLTADRVTEPAGAGSIEAIRRVVLRYRDLHGDLRAPPASQVLRDRMVAWADQIGSRDLASRRASLRVLELAAQAGVGGEHLARRADRERAALAAELAADRPIEALRSYAAMTDRSAVVDRMGEILATFEDGSSLWVEAGDEVEAWLEAAAGRPGAGAARARLDAARARERDPARAALLAGGDAAALAAALAAQPRDQGLAVALARARSDAGEVDAAISALTRLGPPGRLTAEAQAALGNLCAGAGRLAEAERVLAGLVTAELPAFQDAVSRHDGAARATEGALVERAARGDLPAEVESAVRQASPEDEREIVATWLRRELEQDRRLIELADAVARRSHVVPAALSLGTVRLRLAREAAGTARTALLARAEEAFLSVRSQAEGKPELHLGLGQVYYRLGRPRDGERELARVMAEQDPGLRLAVGQIDRELGLRERAIEIAEAVWNGPGDQEVKSSAAILRSLLARDPDEEETWLRRADQSAPYVRRSLLSVRGERELREGRDARADELFAAVAAEYGAEAARDAAAANNAAVAEGRRFACTGDTSRLEKEAEYLAQAYRLQPESPVIAGNLAMAWQTLAVSRAMGAWFDLRAIRAERPEAVELLTVIAGGPARSALRQRLARDPAYRRSAEVLRQWQILAPQDPTPYASEREMLVLLDDGAGLADLRDRLARAELNRSSDFEKWMSGADDAARRAELARRRARYRRLIDGAKRDPRARAAGLLLLAGAARSEAQLAAAPGEAGAAFAERERLLAEAASLAPGLGIERELLSARAEVAIMTAVAASADARAVWQARRRSHGAPLLLDAIAKASPGARRALREALVALAPALGLALEDDEALAGRGALLHWVIARVLDDPAMERRAAERLRRSISLVYAEADARLYPEMPSYAETLALIRQAVQR